VGAFSGLGGFSGGFPAGFAGWLGVFSPFTAALVLAAPRFAVAATSWRLPCW